MEKLTLNDIEKLFDDFQHDDAVERKKHSTIGMFVMMNDTLSNECICEIVERVEDLVHSSERQGFKFGFKLAMQVIGRRGNNPVTNIKEYIDINKALNKC